jgi:hypothetical protein
MPTWVKDGFAKDDMALRCEEVQKTAFLISGKKPAVGQGIYAGLIYDHDGSHPETYRGWARMVGNVIKVGVHIFTV